MARSANPPTPPEASKGYPTVIGLYGVPGSGKSFLLGELETTLNNGTDRFAFLEGSNVISELVPGGLEAFQRLPEAEKTIHRRRAITKIGIDSATSDKPAVVTGHWTFWPEDGAQHHVHTQDDLDIYTHILYLNTPAEIVAQRRQEDQTRSRGVVSTEHIHRWQCDEETQLRHACMEHGILFSTICSTPTSEMKDEAARLIRSFATQDEAHNLALAKEVLNESLEDIAGGIETVLVFDGDRTLVAEDTGVLFWRAVAHQRVPDEINDPLRHLFSGPLGYSFRAFCQANLLYGEVSQDHGFQEICDTVASKVALYPVFLQLLKQEEMTPHSRAIILTCGLASVWKKILSRAGLSRCIVVGGEPNGDKSIVVTDQVKAALVDHLRNFLQCHVIAFGDSPLDCPMLAGADEAFIVVGEETARSKTMEIALKGAIDSGLRARQVLLPCTVPPRLDIEKLPVVDFTRSEVVEAMLGRRTPRPGARVVHSSAKNASKILMTQTRNAGVYGPTLREAHRRVGWYLATEFIGDLLGVEEYSIPHVQGHHTAGYRLSGEHKVLIVALMRAGEPMALGVSDVFPLAVFVHAKQPEDILQHLVDDLRVVILVDSVINSGKTALDFIQLIRGTHTGLHIVLVAGVTQSKTVTLQSPLGRVLAQDLALHLVTLRLSDNKYTGSGTTDTGHRLFNTTHLA